MNTTDLIKLALVGFGTYLALDAVFSKKKQTGKGVYGQNGVNVDWSAWGGTPPVIYGTSEGE